MINISSCIILKNEMPYVMDLINQLSRFSTEVIVTDTGSTDGFLDESNLAKLPSNVKLTHFEWIEDFSAARNENFSHATGDMIFWCDADDVLNDILMERLIEFTKLELDQVPNMIDIGYQYWVERPDIYSKMRLFKRSMNMIWHDRIHEYLCYDINDPVEYFGKDAIILHSHRKPHGDRNLKIYHKMDADGAEFGPRDFYYYANELFNAEYYLPAYLISMQCVMTGEGWIVDKLNAVNLCSILHRRLNCPHLMKPGEIGLHLWNAGVYRSDLACCIADMYFNQQDYKTAIEYYQTAISLGKPSPDMEFLYDPSKHQSYPALQLCLCYDKLGDKQKACSYNELAGSFDPENPVILHNRNYFKSINVL